MFDFVDGHFKDKVAVLIITTTKFIRYCENDIINAAFDSLLDDYYCDRIKPEISRCVENFYRVIKEQRNNFTKDEFETLQQQVYDVRIAAQPVDFETHMMTRKHNHIFDNDINYMYPHKFEPIDIDKIMKISREQTNE